MMQWAYSILETKSFDDEHRIIEGIATTPKTDRVGDVVRSEGAEYALPLPLLWMHDSEQPIGHVINAQVRKDGIRIVAQLPKVANSGKLKDRLDECWDSLKAGLVRGLSIGFSPIEYEMLDGGKGFDFKKWSWLELSAVTVPANSECSVQLLRSLDRKSLAASGKMTTSILLNGTSRPGVAGKSQPQHRGKQDMRTISEYIEGLQNTRAAKAARIEAIFGKSIDEGRSSDPAEAEEIDTLEAEIAALDQDLDRASRIERRQAQAARPVNGVGNGTGNGNLTAYTRGNGIGTDVVDQQRGGLSFDPLRPRVQVIKRQLEPGIEFAQYVMAIAAGRGNLMQSAQIASDNFGSESDVTATVKALARVGSSGNLEIIDRVQKAAVGTGMTTDDNWAAPLVFAYPRFTGDFIEYLRPRTILGNIAGLTRVPFNINIAAQTSGGTAYWVGEGKPKPLTSFDLSSVNFRWAKIATISVLSDEMVRFSNPSAEELVRNELTRSIAERMDVDFVDPGKAAVTNVSPASITNGISPHHSTGNSAERIRGDIEVAMQGFDDYDINLANPYWIMSSTKARQLSLMRNALGQKEFPDMTLTGGMLEGIPVVASRYVSRFGTTGGEYVILINAPDIYYADDGQVTISASNEASLEMSTTPSEDASGGTGASLVSMFQTNSTAILAERYVNWARRRNAAVQVLDMVFWGSSAASGT